MITQKLKTTDGWLRVSIPTQLNEITLGQMMAMQDAPTLNDIEAISILSGIAAEELKQVKDAHELMVFGEHILSLSYQIKHLYNSEAIPQKTTFWLDGKPREVAVIKNLSVEPAGAFMAARDVISDEISEHIKKHGEDGWQEHFNPSLKACCQVLAHYFYCRVTGNAYNEYAIESFTETIKQLRVTEALPIAKHFFTSYPGLSIPRTGFWHRAQLLWNSVREYRRLKNLNTSTP